MSFVQGWFESLLGGFDLGFDLVLKVLRPKTKNTSSPKLEVHLTMSGVVHESTDVDSFASLVSDEVGSAVADSVSNDGDF